MARMLVGSFWESTPEGMYWADRMRDKDQEMRQMLTVESLERLEELEQYMEFTFLNGVILDG